MSIKFSEMVAMIREKVPCAVLSGGEDPLLSEVVSDSRQITSDKEGGGTLFCCITGETSDGHDYAAQAEKQGARALLCERAVDSPLPMIVVPFVRDVMGDVAAAVYGHPAEGLLMVGVTGTNGKTTTTYILRSILQAAGLRSGLLGTIIESDGVTERDADRTTPESCVIQRQLAAMLKNGCKACVMETSSHGLFLGRLRGARYDVPVFTNLNPEHLDFHKDMENYFQAKRLLFTHYAKPDFRGAANAGDPYGKRLVEEFPRNIRGFSLENVPEWSTSLSGTEMTVKMADFPELRLKSPLVGAFNVWNVLCAVSALRGRVDDGAIVDGVASIPQVPGRLERHELPNGACCFIDFAHTPSALRNVLSTVRGLTKGRVIASFGHGGGRYPLNRPELGKAAAELADELIITMDNPRDEDPADIARAIEQGYRDAGGTKSEIILDRKDAIASALSRLGPDDVLVLTGKGPEKYLQIGKTKYPYSDAETVESWIQGKGGRA
ncbi:MAG: UDP-N-acetylmuramoyl-L-alanyl-D-glutamate--2,6-diaminopimelate ligase [Synergistaceae bacterium]|nr:UDP-N-acetylmuramoyl-L-alanyl-D-glutamate--2,6-diaminopimelate ligase [Synergistaceae bacterium]